MYGLLEHLIKDCTVEDYIEAIKSFETYKLHLAFEDSDFHFITPEQLIEL